MISERDLRARVAEWSLRDDVVEKDYVLGWVLAGIGTEPALRDGWVFKGGTCLKKCYLETFRFSEDLDFTVLPGGALETQVVQVEFRPTGEMRAPPTARRFGTARSRAPYHVECPLCGKIFYRQRPGTRLNPHKDSYGFPCSERSGYQIR